jgi:hypothetical protein
MVMRRNKKDISDMMRCLKRNVLCDENGKKICTMENLFLAIALSCDDLKRTKGGEVLDKLMRVSRKAQSLGFKIQSR